MSNDHIKKRALEEITANHGNISKVSRMLGLNVEYLRSIVEENTPETKVVSFPPEREPEDIRDLAKKNYRRFVVAVKRRMSTEGWPAKYRDAIEDARRKYDAGTHEMITGHTRGWAVLYLVPLAVPTDKRNYFGSMTNDFSSD